MQQWWGISDEKKKENASRGMNAALYHEVAQLKTYAVPHAQ